MTIKDKDWNRKDLTLIEQLYIVAIIRGLWLTGKIFFKNLWTYTRGKKGSLTTYYPEEKRPDYAETFRGRHYLPELEPGGRLRCVACKLCETYCPARCIDIAVVNSPEGDSWSPKMPSKFDIDYAKCVFCGYCVEVCPKDAIREISDVAGIPLNDYNKLLLNIDDLHEKSVLPKGNKGKES